MRLQSRESCEEGSQLLEKALGQIDPQGKSKDKLFKVILDMLQNGEYLSSVRFIKNQVAKVHNIRIRESQLTQLMVQDFGMKYKKVKDISYTSNDDKNLILR